MSDSICLSDKATYNSGPNLLLVFSVFEHKAAKDILQSLQNNINDNHKTTCSSQIKAFKNFIINFENIQN